MALLCRLFGHPMVLNYELKIARCERCGLEQSWADYFRSRGQKLVWVKNPLSETDRFEQRRKGVVMADPNKKYAMIENRKCFYCKSTEIAIIPFNEKFSHCVCLSCFIHGPLGLGAEEAIYGWDKMVSKVNGKVAEDEERKSSQGEDLAGVIVPDSSDIKLILSRCPYPYCRSDDVGVESSTIFTSPLCGIKYRVVCKQCKMKGPEKNKELFATQAWNDIPRIEDDCVSSEPEGSVV